MNVSMQDAFNLGWKLAAVLTGRAVPQLLCTYGEERRSVAQELISFDHKWARMFSARPKRGEAHEQGVDPAELQAHFVRQGRFTAGTATCYQPSSITAAGTYQSLAKGFPIGKRFHSAPVLRLADAKRIQLGHTVRADGRWRMFAFADPLPPTDPSSRLRVACEALERSPLSPLCRYLRGGEDLDTVIELIAICRQTHSELSVQAMPRVLLPRKGRYGLVDYEKIYCRLPDPREDIFALRGIECRQGCFVLVRPDQYVADVLPLEALSELSSFFDRFLRHAATTAAGQRISKT